MGDVVSSYKSHFKVIVMFLYKIHSLSLHHSLL